MNHEPAVLIIGAGPTGLALAAQLRRFDVPFRIIDRALDGVHESRALGVPGSQSLIAVHHLDRRERTGVLFDDGGEAMRRLGIESAGQSSCARTNTSGFAARART